MIILNVFRRSVFEDDHLSLFCLLFFLQQPTLSDMTMYEMNFSLLVEDTLKNIVLPEYRQIIVEVRHNVSLPQP